MNFLISICFGAGVAAFVYSKFGRRVGYGNTQNIAVITGVTFFLAAAVFYSIIVLFIPSSS